MIGEVESPPMVKSVGVNGIELYYEDVGEGPPVVFLHGAGGNHLVWWQQLAAFSDGYRCIAPDQRMFGFSEDVPDGPGVEGFVDDLVGLLDRLEIEDVALVSQSMGGWTAAGFASEHPERVAAMVLADTPAGIVDIDPEASTGNDDEDLDLSLAYTETLNEAMQFLYESISGLNRHAPDDVVVQLAELMVDPTPIVDGVDPVMVIAGEEDALTPVPLVRAVHERLPGSSFVTVPRAGHSVYFERPKEFNRLLRTFLADAGYV